ncbi:MAG TPA: helix-turn-helix domain-containing protein [Chloroflexota bacterium]|nr:helix-turn-helix domain-containing protein [Chloroflexota bacterium]
MMISKPTTPWSFLTNHALVLTYIGRHPESTGREVAQTIGITERAVRKIIDDLETAGYIAREKVGRRNRYHINPTRPLPYPGERAVTVGDLLRLLWRDEATVSGEFDTKK